MIRKLLSDEEAVFDDVDLSDFSPSAQIGELEAQERLAKSADLIDSLILGEPITEEEHNAHSGEAVSREEFLLKFRQCVFVHTHALGLSAATVDAIGNYLLSHEGFGFAATDFTKGGKDAQGLDPELADLVEAK
jgi:hypothetical protein